MDISQALVAIEPILASVKAGTEDTLKDLAERFDGVRPTTIRVPQSDIDKALR